MLKPTPPLRSPTSPSAVGSDSVRSALLVLMAAVLMAGCASSGSSGESGGMRAWVDERGQVRYSPAPEGASGQSGGPDEAAESGEAPATESDESQHPVFNLQNFPDADRQSDEPERLFYSWRDAEGRVFNTPYLYKEESMARVMSDPETPKASEARVTIAGEAPAPGFRRNSEAAALMGLGEDSQNRLDAFAENCCQGLPRLDYYELKAERSLSLSLGKEASTHRFSTGESRFALVRLPDESSRTLLRVRSFVRDNGFFAPSAVFLDGRFRPLRLVTDLVLEYTPETWRRYGTMAARLALRPDAGERWVVLFTRNADLETSTAVGEKGRRSRLTHKAGGSLALSLIE